MGNWRTVNLRGSIAPRDVAIVRRTITPEDDWSNFGPLSLTGGMASLGDWVGEEVHADGNLAERDYTVGDVACALREILGEAPSIRLKVHCGGDHESADCVATITVDESGVSVGPPEREHVATVPDDVLRGRLFKALGAP